ncbi:MAG: hypothetical protein KME57_17145 [Scytonema hyalinum WJT4-NPBG1]|nr:hypothetical protein [Scytonema hyalinum WJT4-NPBG1]
MPERKNCAPPSAGWGNANGVCIEAYTGDRFDPWKINQTRNFDYYLDA